MIAAYIVFLVLVLVYVAIMARRLRSTEHELAKLRREVAVRQEHDDDREETGRQPGRSSEAGGRAFASIRGTGGPAEEPPQ